MTDAAKSQPERIARRIVLAIAVPVLLLSAYVSSYVASVWGICHGYASHRILESTVYDPLQLYRRSESVGSFEFRAAVLASEAAASHR